MLSRVADNLYWMARYLERTENIARLADVTARLRLDLPQSIEPVWQALVLISGGEADAIRGKVFNERTAMRHILADTSNYGSMISSIGHAREIARTARDILPRAVWEQINDLYLYINERVLPLDGMTVRYEILATIILRAQTLTGMFEGIFNEGEALSFIALGRNIERADMTSRILDVRAASMMTPRNVEELRPFETLLWINVLRSLSAYQMYRATTRSTLPATSMSICSSAALRRFGLGLSGTTICVPDSKAGMKAVCRARGM